MNWRTISAAQSGVITRGQLLSTGVTLGRVQRMTERGELVQLGRGVFRVGGAPETYRARIWSAVLMTHGVLGYETAGELWGITERRSDVIHVVVRHSNKVLAPPGARTHRWRPREVPVDAVAGLPVTARAWTALSVIASCPRHQAMTVADRALQMGWIGRADIEDRLRRYPKRHGNTQLRIVLTRLGDGAAAESERKLHRLLRSSGIPGWEPNYSVWSNGELVAVVDVAIAERRLAIEIDGMAWHTGADRFQRDRTRQNALVRLGWTVLRFTWADLTQRPGRVIDLIQRVAA